MISRADFDQVNYTQSLNTCVLASYAVAAYPFMETPVIEFFKAYNLHFGSLHPDPELFYESHFHAHPHGYGCILDLHLHSAIALFAQCRNTFTLEDVGNVDLANIEHRLKTEEKSSLMLFVNKSHREPDLGLKSMHSIAVSYSSEDGLIYFDTNFGAVVDGIQEIRRLGECGDRFLLVPKP